MSLPIVFDEWIFHDLDGENGVERQEETFDLLVKLLRICDRIVMLDDSPFVVKWYEFYANAQNDLNRRIMSNYLNDSIFTNDLKIYKLTQEDIKPIPKNLAKLVPISDQYLIQSYLKVQHQSGFIVTTDGKWKHKKLTNKSIDIRMRDDFVKKYLRTNL
ncbi:MAG: hypothetical protein NT162_00690 [Candidatus Woesebacteria bacterium]|nr:hypothetical protein [Candidatus Woesebacteria bacterium]